MDNLRVCVVDDEPLAAQLIAGYVNKTSFLELVGMYGSAQEAVKAIVSGDVDLVFLDINMPQLNGLEFARILPARVKVIFTTAYDNYAVESFKLNAMDYLMKPISYDEFLSSVSRVLNALAQKSKEVVAKETDNDKDRTIFVKSAYRLVQIPVRDIIYVEGVKDYVKICVEGEEKSIMTLMNMRALENELPSSMFMRVHRSFIVNTSKIRVVERTRIIFGNTQIPISESYKKNFLEYVNARLVGARHVALDE